MSGIESIIWMISEPAPFDIRDKGEDISSLNGPGGGAIKGKLDTEFIGHRSGTP
jgi:hypothetical protein